MGIFVFFPSLAAEVVKPVVAVDVIPAGKEHYQSRLRRVDTMDADELRTLVLAASPHARRAREDGPSLN